MPAHSGGQSRSGQGRTGGEDAAGSQSLRPPHSLTSDVLGWWRVRIGQKE